MDDMETKIDSYRAVLWDIDGTLIDTTALIVGALGATFKEFAGKDVSQDELRSLIGTPLEVQLRYLGDPSSYGATVDDMAAYFVRGYERRRDQERVIVEAVDALIELKRRGFLTALVTSKNDVELANTLPRLGISAYCDVIVGADQAAPYFKPHPRPALLAVEQLGVEPRTAVYIGDTVHDIQCGRAAGTVTAAVVWGAATEARLRSEKPDMLFTSPTEIIPALIAGAPRSAESRMSAA